MFWYIGRLREGKSGRAEGDGRTELRGIAGIRFVGVGAGGWISSNCELYQLR
jgi:hypothetical protein